MQLSVDVVQVNFHRAFSDPKLIRDNFIRKPLGDEPGYLCFPSRHRLIVNTISRPSICIVRHGKLPSGMTQRPKDLHQTGTDSILDTALVEQGSPKPIA